MNTLDACKTLANFNPNTEVLFASYDESGGFHCSTRYKFVQAILEFLGCLFNPSMDYNNKKTVDAIIKFTANTNELAKINYEILDKIVDTFKNYQPQLPSSEAYIKVRNAGTRYEEEHEEYANPQGLLDTAIKNVVLAMEARQIHSRRKDDLACLQAVKKVEAKKFAEEYLSADPRRQMEMIRLLSTK